MTTITQEREALYLGYFKTCRLSHCPVPPQATVRDQAYSWTEPRRPHVREQPAYQPEGESGTTLPMLVGCGWGGWRTMPSWRVGLDDVRYLSKPGGNGAMLEG